MIINGKNGRSISSLDDWFKHAPPAKGEKHWVPTRSAFELAQAWLKFGKVEVPIEIARLLESHKDTENIRLESGFPEKETPLDRFGKGRNHDLMLIGKFEGGSAVVSVEAKADEPFGDYVGKLIKNPKPNSDVPNRIELLASALFGHQEINDIRYQLLHAIAGTLIEAKNIKADKAVVIIHQFISKSLSSRKLVQNNADLDLFVSYLSRQQTSVKSGKLLGPISIPGGEFVPGDIPLYIGKVESLIITDYDDNVH